MSYSRDDRLDEARDKRLITVSMKALGTVLQAFVGPPHLIMELRVLRDLHDSPINTLITQYNEEVERRTNGS